MICAYINFRQCTNCTTGWGKHRWNAFLKIPVQTNVIDLVFLFLIISVKLREVAKQISVLKVWFNHTNFIILCGPKNGPW